jgi:hypothetical protein
VVFLNHPIGGTAEDDLLLQVQGVIAEYERAKILERGPARAAPCRAIRIRECADRGSLRISLRESDPGCRFGITRNGMTVFLFGACMIFPHGKAVPSVLYASR